jgi:hypothetical protein
MTHTSTEQPEALRLVELIETGNRRSGDSAIAAELRRLHARVQVLEASQAQRVPLSLSNAATLAASIKTRCCYALPPYASHVIHVAIRETERAHGITQEKQP